MAYLSDCEALRLGGAGGAMTAGTRQEQERCCNRLSSFHPSCASLFSDLTFPWKKSLRPDFTQSSTSAVPLTLHVQPTTFNRANS